MFRRLLPLWCIVLTVVLFGTSLAQDRSAMWNAAKRVKFGLDASTPARPVQTGGAATMNPLSPPNATDIQVFNPSTFWQSENSIGVNFSNASQLMVSTNGQIPGSNPVVQQPWAFSTDGGLTWPASLQSENIPPGIVDCFGDPVAYFDRSGRAYYSTLGSPGGIYFVSTTNFGATWSARSNADPLSSANDDKQHAAADYSGTYPNNVYTAWTDFGVTGSPVIFNRSTNQGATWGTRQTLAIGSNRGQGVHIAIGPNGEVYVLWAHYTTGTQEAGLGFAKSTDGGATFNTPVIAYPYTGIRTSNGGIAALNNTRVSSFPYADVDRSAGPRRGWIYAVHPELVSGQADIFMHRSTDGGTTWSTGIQINGPDVAVGKWQWMPSIAVDPTSGRITVSYYSMDSVGTNFMTNRYAATSIDGGTTWENWVISDVRVNWAPQGTPNTNTNYNGDYYETTAMNGKAWAIWTDRRLGASGTFNRAYVEIIQYPSRFGWLRGTLTQLGTSTPVANAAITVVDTAIHQDGFTNGSGVYFAGVKIDSPATTRATRLRASKFGYVDTTINVTARYPDTTTVNFQIRPAPGGTLSVYSHTATANLRSYVEVKFAGSTVLADSTNGTTGILTAPLPTGTYSVRVDARSPFRTLNYPSVVINAGGTTNIDALTSAVLTFNPAAMRDTLGVGGVHIKTLQMTNTTTDSIPFRIADDNARISFRSSKPLTEAEQAAVARSTQQQDGRTFGKGVTDPRPGQSPLGSGGPDAFGYRWVDSDSIGGGVTFNWTDIRATGTQITTWTVGSGDDGYFTTTLPWSFPVYGTGFASINICTNGFVNFGTGSTSLSNTALPSASAPFNGLFAYWDDLNPGAQGTVHYFNDVPNSQYVVQYTDVRRFGGTTADTLTFQVIIRPNGEVRYQYLRMVAATPNSETIGIQNGTGTVGLQVVFNAAYVHDRLAVRFYLPDAPWLSENPIVGTIPAGGTQNIACTFDATGLLAGTTYNANIFVDATHPDNTSGPFAVPASLRVQSLVGQVISVTPSTVTIPTTVIGSSRTDTTIVVRNIGSSSLTVSAISTVNSRFSVTPTSAVIPSTGSVRLRVTYSPLVPAGADTGKVILISNSGPPSTGRDSVWLYATCVGAPIARARIDSVTKTLSGGNLDSTRFFVRNAGTQNGTFAARATIYPRTEPNKPIVFPMNLQPVGAARPAYLPGDELPMSLGRAPSTNGGDSKENAGEIGNMFRTLGIPAYGVNLLGTPANSLVRIDLAAPGTLVNKGTAVATYAGGFDAAGQYLYAIQNTPSQLIRIDTVTAAQVVIGPTAPATGETFTAMKLDPSTGTWFATSTNITRSTLYTVSPATGTATVVGQIPQIPNIIAMGINNTGQMYGYGLNDTMYVINKTTAQATALGFIGFNANFAQDCDFDPGSGTLYLAAYDAGTSSAQLRTANLTTGNTTLIGTIGTAGSAEIDCFGVSGSRGGATAQWLTVKPPTATINVNDSTQYTATFDARDASIYQNPGSYFGRIDIYPTNAPPQVTPDTLKIQARMTVVPPTDPTLLVDADSINFGNVVIGRTDSSKQVVVRNIGSGALNVTNITFSNPAFRTNSTAFSLTTGQTRTLKLYFTAAAPGGLRTANMTFVSNDVPPTPVVRLFATSLGQASPVVRPDTLFFSRNPTPDTTRTNFRVINVGTDTLRFRIDEVGSEPSEAAIIRSQTQQDATTYPKGQIDPRPGQSPMGSGGPDAFGYRWIDSDEPGGPIFNWTDIRTVGTAVTLTDDSNVPLGALGFTFNYYGIPYTTVNLCSNGWLSFTSTSTSLSNVAIPTAGEPNTALFGFWDDLNPATGGTVHYYRDAANQRFVVQFTDVPHYGTTEPGIYTFQMIINANGTILYQYLNMQQTLNSATIGIENETGTIGLQTVFNAAYVHNNLAVLYTNDILTWASVDRTSGNIAPGDSTQIQLRIHPAGLRGGRYAGRMKVSGSGTPDLAFLRLGLFVIGDTTVTLTAPNGGETWRTGNTYQIAWTTSNPAIDTVKLEYSTTGSGGPWTTITNGTPAKPIAILHPKLNTRYQEGGTIAMLAQYAWTIPTSVPNTTRAFVRVSWKSRPAVSDTSNAAFTISSVTPPETSWVAQTSGFSGILYSVKTVSDSIAWACGAGGRVLRTTNAGTTWSNAGLIGTDCYTITALSANVAVTASSPATGAAKIWKTTDGGVTWVAKDSTGVFWDYVHMWDANTGIAIGDPVSGAWVIKKTSNGGETWTAISPAVPAVGTEAGWNNAMMWYDANNGWFGTNASKIYRSTNGGNTWTSAPTTFVNSYAVQFDQTTVGLAGTDLTTAQFNKSTDAGASWAANGVNMTGAALGMSGVQGTQEFWVTAGTTIRYSSNFGATWVATGPNGYTGTTQQNHVNMIKRGTPTVFSVFGWAVTNTGGIERYRRTPSTGVAAQEPLPTVFALDQNYPNPFNPSTTIRFAVPEQATVTLRVYDVLGREVRTLVSGEQQAGWVKMVWDGQNNVGNQVATGIYFYRFEANSVSGKQFVSLKKAVLLK